MTAVRILSDPPHAVCSAHGVCPVPISLLVASLKSRLYNVFLTSARATNLWE